MDVQHIVTKIIGGIIIMFKSKKFKRTSAALLACAAMVASFATMAVSSYWDGDREVGYYSFDVLGDNSYGVSNNSIKRLYDRNYVVSVTYASNSCGVIYYASNTSGTKISNNSSTMYGVGNTGGSYYSKNTVNTYVRLDAETASTSDPNVVNTYQSGQWSPDNA